MRLKVSAACGAGVRFCTQVAWSERVLSNLQVVNEQKYPHMVSVTVTDSDISTFALMFSHQVQIACSKCVQWRPHPAVQPNVRYDCVLYTVQMSVRNCFIRGSVVRYIQVRTPCARGYDAALTPVDALCKHLGIQLLLQNHHLICSWIIYAFSQVMKSLMRCSCDPLQLPPGGVDIELLHDATRREARGQ